MYIPLVMIVCTNRLEWFLKLNKPLYGIKQASENWFDPLKTGLERRIYHQYLVDPLVFYRKDSDILIYVDYCLIFSNKKYTITSLIK